MSSEQQPLWKYTLQVLEQVDITLWGRIIRRMIHYLYTHNVHQIQDLIIQLNQDYVLKDGETETANDNVPLPKVDMYVLQEFARNVFTIAGEHLREEEIQSQINKWISQEKTLFLSIQTEKSNVSFSEIRDAIDQFLNLPLDKIHISADELTSITVSLIRRFLSNKLSFIRVAKQYFDINDFAKITSRTLGTLSGAGKLGGKTASLLLAFKILEKNKLKYPELSQICIPQSWFITADTSTDFIHFNALEEVVSLKYMSIEEIRAGYPYLMHLFKNSRFPYEIIAQLEKIIDKSVNIPLIVRSSSLLENSNESAFAGKYKSFFISGQGSRVSRLNALIDAICEVYASIFSPDPIAYRKERGLLDFQEEMSILIQEVVGKPIGEYFFPTLSGVALSNNEFPWSSRVSREDGVVRLVVGLGTRAVDRVSDDYPFLGSPVKPEIKVNAAQDAATYYSQKKADVINIESNRFETVEIKDLICRFGTEIPGITQVVSVDRDGLLTPPNALLWDHTNTESYVTFQSMIEQRTLFKTIATMLHVLQDAFQTPVDLEFSWDGKKLYLLQCRSQQTSIEEKDCVIPSDLEQTKILFSAQKYVSNAVIKNIRYIVYVDPEGYKSLSTASEIHAIVNAIFKLNTLFPHKQFILIGPGRWGSRGDIKLGVPVTYSDIYNTAMLIEVVVKHGDYLPEISFGTHFFQDLVESSIRYLPLICDENQSFLNEHLIKNSPNCLSTLLPEMKFLDKVLTIIDTTTLMPQSSLTVLMNQSQSKAVGYLEV